MENFLDMNAEALSSLQKTLKEAYDTCSQQGLKLDMTRGKPCNEQLDNMNELSQILPVGDYLSRDGFDCRNYGLPYGIIEAREFFADILNTIPENIIVGNGSSLSLMYDALTRAMLFGEIDSEKPWSQEPVKKWLCPVPGYDRHFLVTETMGFELIPVPMNENGPDMDVVEELVAGDASIKGMWNVPLYSNPDGYVYSLETCQRLAQMKTAAKDFRIFWDNAYAVHHLYADKKASIPDILSLCEKAGNPNRVYEFASTSKISFAGSGISCIAANKANFERISKFITVQSIGPDKMNELRHVRFFQNHTVLEKVMENHADVIRPKFEKVLKLLDDHLSGTGIAKWNKPMGGYFISLYVYPGTAKKVVSLAASLGVALTPAGATYPYGKDPRDENIRISPSFPEINDVEKAVDVLCICAKLAAVEKILSER